MTGDNRVYSDRAELYDAIYSFKPYAAEAGRLHALMTERGIPDGSRVLEAACGTGSYLRHLQSWYDVTGFDKNEAMLAVARAKVPSVPLFQADMVDFVTEQPFDAVLCLFSSIAYVFPRERLVRAAAAFAAALRPGGLLLVDPFLSPTDLTPGKVVMQTSEVGPLKCARACVQRRSGELAILDFHWIVARDGSDAVEHFTERHELWAIDHAELAAMIASAGFDASVESDGVRRGLPLIVARRL